MSRLYVLEDISTPDGGIRTVMVRNLSVDYIAHCSNPNCKEIGARNQYGRDEICRKCGSPFDWSNEKRWNNGCKYENGNGHCTLNECMYGDFLFRDDSRFNTGYAICTAVEEDLKKEKVNEP